MLFKKKNQIKDERIEKETNKVVRPVFYLFSAALLAGLVVKLVLGEPWQNFLLEILCLVPSWAYLLVKGSSNGVLWLKEKDEALCGIRDEIASKAYMTGFWILTTGQLVYMYYVMCVVMADGIRWCMEMNWELVYLATNLIPALIISIFSVKKGWLVWGSKKREVTGKKEFAKRTVLGALVFGVLMGLPEVFKEGGLRLETVLMMLGMGAAWGVLFYFAMIAVVKISEKNADKAVKEKEEESEE
ncbi:MAG: hypothetical protein J6J42_10050 [Lachnospiraceae bacterium]|nr:hypothetical protein [Lachnospiraceae bacterium]